MPDPNQLSPWQQVTPLLGSLAAAYFAAIRSPRRGGVGGALGNAGATGLGTYAEMMNQQALRQRAAMQNQLDQMQLAQGRERRAARGKLSPEQQQQYDLMGAGPYGQFAATLAGAKQNNQSIGGSIMTLVPSLPPAMQPFAKSYAGAITNSLAPGLTIHSAMQDILNQNYGNLKAQEAQAQIGATQARTGLYQAQAGAVPSAIARNQAEASAAANRGMRLFTLADGTTAWIGPNQPVPKGATPASGGGGMWFQNSRNGVSRRFGPNETVPAGWTPIVRPSATDTELNTLLGGGGADASASGYGGAGSAPMSKPPSNLWGKTVTGPDGRKWYIDRSGNPHAAD